MANVYHKILSKNISRDYTESIITGLQRELTDSANYLNRNVYDMTRGMSTRRFGLDVDSLLKYYVINQMLKEIPENNSKALIKKQYFPTANKNYYKDIKTNQYYKKSGDEWVLAENVVQVNENGSYVVLEKHQTTNYMQKKVYDISDLLVSIQVTTSEGRVISNMLRVVDILDLRKEVARKYKYSGYSGNSNDILAAILNKFSGVKETGFYMDKYYNLFFWDEKQKCFVKYNDEYRSPLLVDYVFENTNVVIRKEYTGAKY